MSAQVTAAAASNIPSGSIRMPIEFRCVTCQKLLRVGDEAVGKKARCPDCGTIQEARSHPGLNQTVLPNTTDNSPFSPVVNPPIQTANPFAEFGPTGVPVTQTTSNPYLPPQTAGSLAQMSWEAIQAKVRTPAIAMLIASGLAIAIQITAAVGLIVLVAVGNAQLNDFLSNIVGGIFGMAISSTIAYGAVKMRRMESYGLAITASILSTLPCSGCCIFSMPFGIWSLIVLLDPQVKQAFR